MDDIAIAVFNFSSNGMGGLDGRMVDLAVDHFGIDDMGDLMDRLYVIKTFDSKRAATPTPTDNEPPTFS